MPSDRRGVGGELWSVLVTLLSAAMCVRVLLLSVADVGAWWPTVASAARRRGDRAPDASAVCRSYVGRVRGMFEVRGACRGFNDAA